MLEMMQKIENNGELGKKSENRAAGMKELAEIYAPTWGM